MKIREYEGVFYNLEDFDANGRPYQDAVPLNLEKETEDQRKLKIQKAQMADDVHNDKHKKDCKKSGCNCMNEYILLFSTNTHEGVKYDTYGFEIKDLL
jgi:predicted metalloenzyme YecM